MRRFALKLVAAAGSLLPAVAFGGDILVTPTEVAQTTSQLDANHLDETLKKRACVAANTCFSYEVYLTAGGIHSVIFPGGWIAFMYEPEKFPNARVDAALEDHDGDGYADIRVNEVVFTYNAGTGCFEPPFDSLFTLNFSRTWCAGAGHRAVSRVVRAAP